MGSFVSLVMLFTHQLAGSANHHNRLEALILAHLLNLSDRFDIRDVL